MYTTHLVVDCVAECYVTFSPTEFPQSGLESGGVYNSDLESALDMVHSSATAVSLAAQTPHEGWHLARC